MTGATASACAFWGMDSWSSGYDLAPDASAPDASTPDASGGTGDAGSGAYAAVVASDAPLAYFRLDERSGAVATDSSGNGRHATIIGDVTLAVPGALREGTAMLFSGGRLEVGEELAFFDRAPFTIEAWIAPSTVDGVYRRIVSRERPEPPRGGYSLWLQAEPEPRVGFERMAGDDGVTVETTLPRTGAWVHVVATYDGSQQVLYVDGRRREAVANTASIGPHSDAFIGAGTNYGNSPYLGSLDELAIYGVALSEERVQAHHRAR